MELTTSSHTLSLSHPDPKFGLILTYKIFHSPHPDTPVTISAHRSVSELDYRIAFRLNCTTDDTKSVILAAGYVIRDPIYKDPGTDLKEKMLFVTIPGSGKVQTEHVLPLGRIFNQGKRWREENLRPGMRYRVWMRHAFLNDKRRCYWGDLRGDLKGKKLSSWSAAGEDRQSVDYPVLESGGHASQITNAVEVRANFGRYGPEFELVE